MPLELIIGRVKYVDKCDTDDLNKQNRGIVKTHRYKLRTRRPTCSMNNAVRIICSVRGRFTLQL